MENNGNQNEIDLFDDYLRYGTDDEAPKGERTRKAYCYTAERLLEYAGDRQLSPELAREFVKDMEANGNSPTSINRHVWALKSFFRYKGLDLRMRGLKTHQYRPRFLRDKEWNTLLKATLDRVYDPDLPTYGRLQAKRELALLYAYGGAGLRLSEALGLQNEDVLDEGFLRVIRKGGREDFVPIEDEILRGIRDYIETKGPNGRFIFSGKEHDTPMAPRTAQSIIKNLCRRVGLNDVHVHSLRHTVGYQLRKLGTPIESIRDVLGHQNISTTQIYAHLVDEELRQSLPKRFANARQGRLDWK